MFYFQVFIPILNITSAQLPFKCILVCGAFLKVKKNTVIEFNMELEYCVYIHGNTIAFLYSVFVHVSEHCLACFLLY